MNERIIDLIKKLIRHERSARKCSTPEEAAAFAAKVQQLCIDHKIAAERISVDDETTANAARIDHEKFATSRSARFGYGVSVRGEDSRLMQIIARAHFCKALSVIQSNCILIVGEEQDRAVCIEMFQYLRSTMRIAAIREEDIQRKRRRTVRRFFYWFCLGFVQTIEKRYAQLRAAADNTTTALVRADALVKQYVAENFETVESKPRRTKGRMNLEAALAGMRHGHAVSLSKNVVGSEQE